MPRPYLSPADHYLLKTIPLGPDDCWIWMGYLNKRGYGEFKVSEKVYTPHRWAYELATGEVLGSRHAHHTCENPRCVNPDHINPVTPVEHVNLHAAKKWRERTHCSRGHEYTEESVYRHGGRRHCKPCAALRARGKR